LTGAAAEYSKETERRTGRKAGGVFIPLSVLEKRNTTGTAGQIIGTDHRADQFIEPFRNKLLARQLGARVLTGLQGNVDIPGYGSGVSSGWVAENGALTASGMTFGSKTLTPKHVGSLAEMSRQLIQQSSPGIEQLLRDDMAFALAQAIDSAMILGGGTNEPTGILATAGIQTSSLSTLSWAGILAMLEKIELANGSAGAWLTSPAVATKLRGTLKSSTAGAQYLAEAGRLAELTLNSTKQVPVKTGTPNKGRLILGDFSQVMLGVWSELDVLVNPFDSVAYARGGVLVRAMATCDIAVRHPEAFVVADDVTL
jgi:HK97 family phage major capsid protein